MKQSRLIKTLMMKRYMIKLIIRITVFVIVLLGYLFDRERLFGFMMQPIKMGVTPLHLLWLMFMVMMIAHIFPTDKLTMALRKSQKETYEKTETYSKEELYAFVQNQNVRAWLVMLVWLIFNAIFGLLYVQELIDEADLFMLTVFYFLCDYICILFFCPFQTFIMKNKCCVNCRIYDWGHFMMFTPMLFIRNFFCWSLFFTACVVLIRWEIIYAMHPERFWSGSNTKLQCSNCKDKTCQMKNRLARKI